MTRPAIVDPAHDFGPEPEWGLLPASHTPRCDTCGRLATESHDPAGQPTTEYHRETPAAPRRYYGD